jgi:hypothetical protein
MRARGKDREMDIKWGCQLLRCEWVGSGVGGVL